MKTAYKHRVKKIRLPKNKIRELSNLRKIGVKNSIENTFPFLSSAIRVLRYSSGHFGLQ